VNVGIVKTSPSWGSKYCSKKSWWLSAKVPGMPPAPGESGGTVQLPLYLRSGESLSIPAFYQRDLNTHEISGFWGREPPSVISQYMRELLPTTCFASDELSL
jgi:hypothetical protein